MVKGSNPPTYIQFTLFTTSDMSQGLVPICVLNQPDHFTNINEDVISTISEPSICLSSAAPTLVIWKKLDMCIRSSHIALIWFHPYPIY